MNMIVRCPNCQKTFNANYEQKSLVESAIKKNMRLVFIKCPECYQNVPINPSDLLSKVPQKDADKKDNNQEVIECPICHDGVVCYIDDKDEQFWGCGECGNIWKTKDDLEKDINKKVLVTYR